MDDSKFKNLMEGLNKKGSFDRDIEKPVWFNEKKFEEGKKFYRDHVAACGFSMMVSLISGKVLIRCNFSFNFLFMNCF